MLLTLPRRLEAIRTVRGDDRGNLMYRTKDNQAWVEADNIVLLGLLQKRIKRLKGETIFTGEYAAYSKELGKHGAIHFQYFELRAS